ncbi:MAG: histidinol-phosphate transaminase [Phycisphaerae bacterium]|nr:histidinol-phosphate transaminase [Phycisphaerae bacterium]
MNYSFNENVEKLVAYTPGFQPDDPAAIKINTNENPYPPSPKVFEALAGLTGDALRKYPPIFWDDFRKVAGEVHDVSPDHIVCGNGADELLAMLIRCCCNRRRPMAYPVPTYTLYPTLGDIQDCPVIEVPWGPGCQLPKELATTHAKLTFLCNPNAPTGTIIPVDAVGELAGRLDGVLAVDEAYVDFAEDNCLRLLKEHDNLIILRTMSKGYSLAGMRFGYAIGSKPIVDALLKVKDSYNVNVAAQVAAKAALADRDYFQANVQKIKQQRNRVAVALQSLGFDLAESHTNFLLAKITKPTAKDVYDQLIERNIFVRYFSQKELNDKLRISIGSVEQNDALLAALNDILK